MTKVIGEPTFCSVQRANRSNPLLFPEAIGFAALSRVIPRHKHMHSYVRSVRGSVEHIGIGPLGSGCVVIGGGAVPMARSSGYESLSRSDW